MDTSQTLPVLDLSTEHRTDVIVVSMLARYGREEVVMRVISQLTKSCEHLVIYRDCVDEWDPQDLESIYDDIRRDVGLLRGKCPRILIVIDNYCRRLYEKVVTSIAYSCRHYNVILILTVADLRELPPCIRVSVDYVIYTHSNGSATGAQCQFNKLMFWLDDKRRVTKNEFNALVRKYRYLAVSWENIYAYTHDKVPFDGTLIEFVTRLFPYCDIGGYHNIVETDNAVHKRWLTDLGTSIRLGLPLREVAEDRKHSAKRERRETYPCIANVLVIQ